ncbi:hypothetical protein AB0D11_46360 [Streptomyces monashensis]|uniref:hypothetical protein n=1 Tax=Streptomyces monashensis TaxID=1678012 RepID=UPI0033FD6889
MPLDDQSTRALLRQLDDPQHMEFPRGYDPDATRARFEQLAARLNARFQCTCIVDRQVQDASHHGTIVIPATAADSAEHITVTISNFGNLAVVTLGNPGSYSEEEARELLHATDRLSVEEELEALDYTVISEHLLWTRYDGVSGLVSYYPPEYPPTWWTRFFDYL